jgi:protein transport protein SEC20
LESKRTIDSLSKSHRDELLGSSAVSEKQEFNEKVTDDALMAASDNVTDAMQRTMALMQGELKRSVLTAQMLGICIHIFTHSIANFLYSRLYRNFAVHLKHP